MKVSKLGVESQEGVVELYKSLDGLTAKEVFDKVTLASFGNGIPANPELRGAIADMVDDVSRQLVGVLRIKGDQRKKLAGEAYLIKLRKMVDPEIADTMEMINVKVEEARG